MKTRNRQCGSVFTTMLLAMILVFIAANTFAISPDEWQNRVNGSAYYDLTPSGEIAIVNDCRFTDGVSYKILFGALHGVRVSGPNMQNFKGNNFIITLGAGENGYAGQWGYEVFVEPRPKTFFAIVIGKREMVSGDIWFTRWHDVSAKEFERVCGKYVPYLIAKE